MRTGWIAAVLIGLLAGGCATQMGAPRPSLPVLESLRSSGLPAMRVGQFARGPSLSASDDHSIGIRASSLSSPVNGSFAAYLGETLTQNLRAAGLLDANSNLVIEGLLTRSEVGSGLPNGHGALAARFTLTRNGQVLFDRELTVEAEWPSSFIGAEAIPEAANQYGALYNKVVLRLFSDPEFRAAARAP